MAGVMRGEPYENGSPGGSRIMKKLTVVTMSTTISDCASRATMCRRIRECDSGRAQPDAIALDLLRGIDRPSPHVHGPTIRSCHADVHSAMYRVDEHDVIEPDRRHIVRDDAESTVGERVGLHRIECGGRRVEEGVDLLIRIALN